MTRATGGSAAAATSTRSSPFEYAYSRASSVDLIPICSPSSPTRRTWGTRMFSLIRSCGCEIRRSSGRRLGLKGSSPSSLHPPSRRRRPLQAAATFSHSNRLGCTLASSGPGKVRGSGPLLLSGLDRSKLLHAPDRRPPPGRRSRPPAVASTRSGARGFGPKTFNHFREAQGRLPAAALAHREGVVRLAVAVDDRVRNLLELRVTDPPAKGLVALVDVHPEALRLEPTAKLLYGSAMGLAHGDQPDLHRREPEGEGPRVVLGEDADEPLQRAEQGAVDDHRRVLGVVGSHVREPELARHLVVGLDRPHLPGAAERVAHVQVDLRSVEGALAWADDVLDPMPLERRLQDRLGVVPFLRGPETVLRPGRELRVWGDAEDPVQVLGELDAGVDLRRRLLLRAEDVGVVLGDVTDPEEAVQRSRELVPVQGRALGVADRQVAVAPEARAEQEHMPWAVHRLQARVRLGVVVGGDQEHVLAELVPVAARLPDGPLVDERRLHLAVAPLRVLAAAQILELVPEHHPLRVPERRARRLLREVEEVELAPEPAVVARPRLLEPLQVCVEVGLRVEGGAVDPGQLRVALVAAPVGAGERGELDRLDRLRVLEVGAATEVGELALRVERDLPLGGVDELDLVRLTLRQKAALRLLRRDLLALPRAAFLQLAHDLGLDLLEVLLADRHGELEVVVEAVLDRRADRDLGARIEPADRLREQVRGRVAQHEERIRIVRVAGRQDLDRLAVLERQPQVLGGAVLADQHRLLGQLRADRPRGVEAGGAVRKFEFRRVGGNHAHDRSGY